MRNEEKTIVMCVIIKEAQFLPLKIYSVEQGILMSNLIMTIVSTSHEYKHHYNPIKDIPKHSLNLREKKRTDGYRQISVNADKTFNQKIKIMALVNDVTQTEILNYIIIKYCPKLPSQHED